MKYGYKVHGRVYVRYGSIRCSYPAKFGFVR